MVVVLDCLVLAQMDRAVALEVCVELVEAVVQMAAMPMIAFLLALAVRMEEGQAVAHLDLLLEMVRSVLFAFYGKAITGLSPQLA